MARYSRDISNTDDVIDSRDVIARIEELEGILADAQEELDDEQDPEKHGDERDAEDPSDIATCGACGLSWNNTRSSSRTPTPSGRCPFEHVHEEAEELRTLKALEEEAASSPDWTYGETLIRDSYFREYAEQLADDLGAVDRDARWPVCYIDWDAAADALKQDYSSVDFDGVTYWIRA